MSWISAAAVYFIIWWTVLFAMLPFGLRTQDEDKDVTLGTIASAPRGRHMGRAFLRTTLVSAVIFGIFMLIKGRAEAADLANVDRQRKLLGVIGTRGQVSIGDAVLEMNSTRDQVQSDLHALVSRGLFSGYVDWSKGILYSVEASKLQGRTTCPNCGGQLELAGKGLVKCPYCGAEIFLQ